MRTGLFPRQPLLVGYIPVDEEGPRAAPGDAARHEQAPGEQVSIGTQALHAKRSLCLQTAGAKALGLLLNVIGRQRITDQATLLLLKEVEQRHAGEAALLLGLDPVVDREQFDIVQAEADNGIVGTQAGMATTGAYLEAQRPVRVDGRIQIAYGNHSMI